MTKVFQIGFNKCGTSSLYRLFFKNRLKSCHWDLGKIALDFKANITIGKLAFEGTYSDYIFFSDMIHIDRSNLIEVYKYFDILDSHYPGSKFILNTRDIDKWISSRLHHGSGSFFRRFQKYYDLSDNEIIDLWEAEWFLHTHRVLAHFKDRAQDLLVFDIEKDSPEKISVFLQGIYNLHPEFYEHRNKTKTRRTTV